MIELLATDDLKTLVEKATVNLLCADEVLASYTPSINEFYGDSEPTEQNAGLLRNPLIYVKTSGAGSWPGTQYRKIKVEAIIELEPNEETKLTGIAPFFKRIEDILDNYQLHIDYNTSFNDFFICAGTYARDVGSAKKTERGWDQSYSFEGIFIAK